MKHFKRYKVCICPECGNIQLTSGEKLKCVFCKKVREFRVKGMWHVKLRDFDSLHEANIFMKALQEARQRTNGD